MYFNPLMFTSLTSAAYNPTMVSMTQFELPNMNALFNTQNIDNNKANFAEFKASTSDTAKQNTAKFIKEMLKENNSSFNGTPACCSNTYVTQLNKLLEEYASNDEATLKPDDFAKLQRIANDYAKYGKILDKDVATIKKMIEEKYTGETVTEAAARVEQELEEQAQEEENVAIENELKEIDNKYIPQLEDKTDSEIREMLRSGNVAMNENNHVTGEYWREFNEDTTKDTQLQEDFSDITNKIVNVIIDDMKKQVSKNGQTWTKEMDDIAKKVKQEILENAKIVSKGTSYEEYWNNQPHITGNKYVNDSGYCDDGAISGAENYFFGLDSKRELFCYTEYNAVVNPTKLTKEFYKKFNKKAQEKAEECKCAVSPEYKEQKQIQELEQEVKVISRFGTCEI